nr:DUF5074 domain-containing protein [uncultured Flavobacterium sp.]
MKNFKRIFLAVLVSSTFFVSCSDNDDENREPRGNYDGGVIILNEGNNGTANASVSYLSTDLQVENNVFSTINPDKVTGDTAQNIGFNGDNAYLVLNGSNKIEVVNRYTFKSIATITTKLVNPRYITFSNGKGYVTNWGAPGDTTDDYVAVLDLSSNTVTSTIPVKEGPEKILENDGKLYVTHKGGWGFGNSLTIINASTNTVITNFVVGDIPSALVKDNGTLYVLCDGMPYYAPTETPGKIVKINLNTNAITSTINFTGITHPGFLDIEDNKLYYTVGNSVYTAPTSTTTLPATALFKVEEITTLYGFAVEDDKIYLADALNYSDPGDIYIYSTAGAFNKTFSVGILPNGFYFND